MGTITSFSISVAIILALEYLAYKSLMARTTNFHLNRLVILASYVMALAALPVRSWFSQALAIACSPDIILGPATVTFISDQPASAVSSHSILPHNLPAIPVIYIIGIAVTAMITLVSYARMAAIIRSGSKRRAGGVTIVTVDSDIIPFSWGRYVVVSRRDSDNQLIISHELLHISRSHSIDLIFARLFTIFNWFNPAAWLMAEELSACHEYEVDHLLISRGTDLRQYQMLIIKKAAGPVFETIANSLNHSQLKNRLTMMSKTKTKRVRSFAAAAMLLAAIVGVAVTNYPAVASTLKGISAAHLSIGKGSEKTVTGQIPVTTLPAQPSDAQAISAAKPVAVNEEPVSADTSKIEESCKYVSVASEEKVVTFNPNPAPAAEEAAEVTEEETAIPDDIVVKQPDVLPSYPGGDAAMFQAICKELRFPEELAKENISARNVVTFVINTDGTISDIQVARSSGYEAFDKEAVRAVAAALPEKWIPGTQDGKPVRVSFAIPLTFKVQ